MPQTLTLYRPVGLAELRLIQQSGFTSFPPRLPSQPIFYPVTTQDYAETIARDWNTKDAASGYQGIVLRFRVRADYLSRFPVRTVGGRHHQEYWIPAEELEDFNTHIDGQIEIVAEFTGT